MSKRLLCCLGLLVTLVISTGLAEAATTGKSVDELLRLQVIHCRVPMW